MYRLGLIVGPRAYRHVPEISQYADLPHFDVVSLGCGEPWVERELGHHWVQVNVRRLLPDSLAQRLVRKPYGPVSFISFDDLEANLIDVDIINSVELYSFVSRQCARIAKTDGTKLLVVSWETIPNNPLFRLPPYFFNLRQVARHAFQFIVPTKRAAICLRHNGIPAASINLHYHGVDLSLFSGAKTPHEGIRILYVGRLDNEKGVGILLRAFILLHRENPSVELYVVGPPRSGSEIDAELRRASKKHPIRVLGQVSRQRIPQIYAECDIFCIPSFDRVKWLWKVWEEQFGWATVEAMASGLPIVTSDAGANMEVVGENNIIVPQKSVEGTYIALRELCQNYVLRERLGEMNRKRAEGLFDLRKQRQALDSMLVSITEQ